MSEAESFNFAGNPSGGYGSGFPFCPFKKDISTYDYWTTLSGWSAVDEPVDDAAKAASIAESLRLAMKFHWNAELLNCDATTSGTASSDGSISTIRVNYETYERGETEFDPPILIDSGAATPSLRMCIPYSGDQYYKIYDYSEFDGSANGKFAINSITAMYDGLIFVGYGLGFVETRFQSTGTIEAQAGGLSTLNAGVYAGGYGYTPDNTTNDVFGVGYVTFGDLEVFAYVEAKDGPNPAVSGSVNLSSLSASCTFAPTTTATASLSSIDFYTYPA